MTQVQLEERKRQWVRDNVVRAQHFSDVDARSSRHSIAESSAGRQRRTEDEERTHRDRRPRSPLPRSYKHQKMTQCQEKGAISGALLWALLWTGIVCRPQVDTRNQIEAHTRENKVASGEAEEERTRCFKYCTSKQYCQRRRCPCQWYGCDGRSVGVHRAEATTDDHAIEAESPSQTYLQRFLPLRRKNAAHGDLEAAGKQIMSSMRHSGGCPRNRTANSKPRGGDW